jgi:hypothetical protein
MVSIIVSIKVNIIVSSIVTIIFSIVNTQTLIQLLSFSLDAFFALTPLSLWYNYLFNPPSCAIRAAPRPGMRSRRGGPSRPACPSQTASRKRYVTICMIICMIIYDYYD